MPTLQLLTEEVLQLTNIFSIIFSEILLYFEGELPHAAELRIILRERHAKKPIFSIYSLKNPLLVQRV